MMLSKDGTSIIGKIGFLLPLLILFIAADAAACPEHRSGSALRTKAVKIKNGGHMRTTVIGYRAPATYRLCGNTLRDTRGVAYVRDGFRSRSSARYVAVRSVDRSPRYVAVRNVDRAPRYVAIRRTTPAYVDDSGVRYAAVRDVDRHYVPNRTRRIVHGIDIGPDPQYVAVRQAPMYVDNADRKYVAVRNTVREIDIDEPRYVSVRNVDRYDSGTRYVAVRDRDEDFAAEIEEVELRDEPLERTHVVEYSDAAFLDDDDDAAFISTGAIDDSCAYPAAVRTSPMVETRMVSYVVDDDDIDDHAFLRVGTAAPSVASYRPVSYTPVDDDVIEVEDNDVEYVATDAAMSTVSYIPVDDEIGMITDGNVMYVAADDVDNPCVQRVRTCSDVLDTNRISYVSPKRSSVQTVSYVPVDEVEHVRYVAVNEAETVSYVPVNNAVYADVSEIDTVDCPITVSSVDAAPLYVSNPSTTLIEVREADYDAGFGTASRIATNIGYRDGFQDGADAAAEFDAYHPENSGDYKKATNGYEDNYGDKDLYKESYRSAYLTGYRAGFDSVGVDTNIG